MSNITLDTIQQSLLEVTYSETKWGNTQSDPDAKRKLADLEGVDETQFSSVNRFTIPKRHAGPYLDVVKALADAKKFVYDSTLPIGFKPNGKASGKRAVTTDQIMTGKWLETNIGHTRAVDAAREAFAQALPRMMAAVSSDPDYAAKFDATMWPTAEQIRASFKFSIEGPDPIGSFDYLPITGVYAEAMEKRFQNRLAKQLEFGQMKTAQDMLDYANNMARAMQSLGEYHEGKREKQPPVYATLTTNLEHIVGKARTFAVANTESGAALLAMADKIEQYLIPKGRTAEDFKDNPPLARETALKAAELVDALEEISFDF